MSVLTDLSAILAAAGITQPVFFLKEPDVPAECVTLYPTGGPALTDDFSGDSHGPATYQVRWRSATQAGAVTLGDALYAVFRGVRFYPAQYLTAKATSAAFFSYPAGRNNETVGSFNVQIWKGA